MNKRSKADIERDVLNRLDKITFHFEERDNLCSELPLYTRVDTESETIKSKDLRRLLARIQNEEFNIFHELVYLKGDVDKYFNVFGLNIKETGMVVEFKPYRIAANFVDTQRTQESNGVPANKKYYTLVFKVSEGKSASNNPITAYISFINYEGNLIPSIDLILDLIKIWDMFLINHTDIDVKDFEQRFHNVKNRQTVYSAPAPKCFVQSIAKVTGDKVTKLTMSKKKETAIETDILNRLKSIAFHYEERDNLNNELMQYTKADLLPKSDRSKDLERLLTRIQNQEIYALYELVHLQDNIKKYLDVFGFRRGEICVVDEFKSFRIAANFANTHKHGVRGRNAKSSKIDYNYFFFERKGCAIAPGDPIIGVEPVINYDGNLNPSRDIILDLIIIWQLFLKYHTKIDIEPFNKNIKSVRARHEVESVYSTPIPKGMIDDAKRLADERKNLDV
jgi:hypothetical protein